MGHATHHFWQFSAFDGIFPLQLARESDDKKQEKSDDDSDDDDDSDSDDEVDEMVKKLLKKSKSKTKLKSKKTKSGEEEITAREWVRFFYTMIEPVEPRTRLVDPYVSFAKMLFRYAVRSREKGDFKDALYCLDEIAFPLGEAERLSSEKTRVNGVSGSGDHVAVRTANGMSQGGEAKANHIVLLDEIRVTREEVTMEKVICRCYLSHLRERLSYCVEAGHIECSVVSTFIVRFCRFSEKSN